MRKCTLQDMIHISSNFCLMNKFLIQYTCYKPTHYKKALTLER